MRATPGQRLRPCHFRHGLRLFATICVCCESNDTRNVTRCERLRGARVNTPRKSSLLLNPLALSGSNPGRARPHIICPFGAQHRYPSGPYQVISFIGAGGMGEVYKARDTRLQRDVAMKVLPTSVASDPEQRARFEREARAVAALSHPNVLAIFDSGSHEGRLYAVTELLEGETLRDRLRRERSLSARPSTGPAQIARGLAAAHDKGWSIAT